MKTQTVSSTVSKSIGNTPIRATPKQIVALSKVNAKDQAIIKSAIAALSLPTKANAQSTTAKPSGAVFSLVAGTVRAIVNKQIAGAIAYHVKLGNLEKTDTGVKLTAQGAAKFGVDRVAHSPDLFQTIAAWMHKSGNTPPDVTRWDGQHKAIEIAAGVKFPNYIHWGSFASKEMRLAFAAIWAK